MTQIRSRFLSNPQPPPPPPPPTDDEWILTPEIRANRTFIRRHAHTTHIPWHCWPIVHFVHSAQAYYHVYPSTSSLVAPVQWIHEPSPTTFSHCQNGGGDDNSNGIDNGRRQPAHHERHEWRKYKHSINILGNFHISLSKISFSSWERERERKSTTTGHSRLYYSIWTI